MEDWQKDFFAMVETMTFGFEQFFQDVSEIVETVADEMQDTVAAEIDQFLEDVFDPFVEIYAEFEFELEDGIGDTELLLPYKVKPTPENHPACIGCHHYHGQIYGGNLLVCGMHPYGWDDQNCPDWEATHSNSFDFNNDFF